LIVAPRSEVRVSRPWHREPWPWFIIGLLSAAVIASLVTLYIAVANPDYPVIDETEYDRIKSELRAQASDASPENQAEPEKENR
jgi:hypothetical protein